MPSSVLIFNKVFSVADPRLADRAVLHVGDQGKRKPGGLQWDRKKQPKYNWFVAVLFLFVYTDRCLRSGQNHRSEPQLAPQKGSEDSEAQGSWLQEATISFVLR